ncbi:Serine/threonine-protein kinase TOR [Entamoeba marina]
MSTTGWTEKLISYIDDLRQCTTKEQRELKAEGLKSFFIAMSSEFHGESDTTFIACIILSFNEELKKRDEKDETNNKQLYLAILCVIDIILSSDFGEVFCKEVCKDTIDAIMKSGSLEIVKKAAKYIGKIVRFNLHDYIDNELEYIDRTYIINTPRTPRTDSGSYQTVEVLSPIVRVIILREIIVNSPSTCYTSKDRMKNIITQAVYFNDYNTRIEAEKTLFEYLSIVKDSNISLELYTTAVEHMIRSAQVINEGEKHGAMLVLVNILKTTKDVDGIDYYQVLTLFLSCITTTKNSLLRKTAILALSDFLRIDKEKFCPDCGICNFNVTTLHAKTDGRPSKNFKKINQRGSKEVRVLKDVSGSKDDLRKDILHENEPFATIMTTLLDCFRNGIEKPSVFKVFGDFCEYVPFAMKEYFRVDGDFHLINKGEFDMIKKVKVDKERRDLVYGIFYCITKVIRYLKEVYAQEGDGNKSGVTGINEAYHIFYKVYSDIHECGFNEHSVELFQAFFNAFTEVKKQYQDIFIKMIRSVLFSDHKTTQTTPIIVIDQKELILLALRTLHSFNFDENITQDIIPLVKETILQYIDNDDVTVRKEVACLTKVLLPKNIKGKNVQKYDIEAILQVLLIHGLSDLNSGIRYTIMSHLDDRFDYYLSQTTNIQKLFIALNDESFKIRQQVICIICRLTSYNFIFVMPSFRKIVIQLLSQLSHGFELPAIEESVILLGNVVKTSGSLILPYSEAILEILLPKLKEAAKSNLSSLTSNLLKAVGALICLGSVKESFIHNTLDVIIAILHEKGSSNQKTNLRLTALQNLTKISRNASCAVELYASYPELLDLLMELINSERSQRIKTELVTVVGVMGALDPSKYRQFNAVESIVVDVDEGADVIIPSISVNEDEYYAWSIISTMIKVLKDNTLSAMHQHSISAIRDTLNSMYSLKDIYPSFYSFISHVFASYVKVFTTCQPTIRTEIIKGVSSLLSIADKTIRDTYLPKMFKLIEKYWDDNILADTLNLCHSASITIKEEFKQYLPTVIPLLLKELSKLKYSKNTDVSKIKVPLILKCFQTFADKLELDDHLYLIVPVFLDLLGDQVDVAFKQIILLHLFKFFSSVNLNEFAGRIIFTLIRLLENSNLRESVVMSLSSLATKLGPQYFIFHPTVRTILSRCPCQNVNVLEEAIVIQKSKVECFSQIISIWDTSTQRSKKEEWSDWVEKVLLSFLKLNPSPLLNRCHDIANNNSNSPVARDLFNCSFYSLYTSQNDEDKEKLIYRMKNVIEAATATHEVVSLILNLAEFLEHEGLVKPIISFGDKAKGIGAYAKALHYKEIEFKQSCLLKETTDIDSIKEGVDKEVLDTDETSEQQKLFEDLIGLNNQLQKHDAATGLIQMAEKRIQMKLNSTWFAKLGMWNKALLKLEEEDQSRCDVKIKCLYEMGDWEALDETSEVFWKSNPKELPSESKKTVSMIAASSFYLEKWEQLRKLLQSSNSKEMELFDQAFYTAVLSLHDGDEENLERVSKIVENQQTLLGIELGVLASEGYERSYDAFTKAQIVTEIDEILGLIRGNKTQNREVIQYGWNKRLINSQKDIKTWQRILKLRQLVLEPHENISCWVKFTGLCHKKGEQKLAFSTLNKLAGHPLQQTIESLPTENFEVGVEYLKLLWKTTKEMNEKQKLFSLLQDYQHIINAKSSNDTLRAIVASKLGEWQLNICQSNGSFNTENIKSILDYHHETIVLTNDCYKYWHKWALVNFEVVSYFDAQKISKHQQLRKYREELKELQTIQSTPVTDKEKQIVTILESIKQIDNGMIQYVETSVNAFVQSLLLTKNKQTLQDTLRLLTILFKYGKFSEVEHALSEGIKNLPVDIWLHVVPQIIARIQSEVPSVRRLTKELLTIIGENHPQAIVYALTVASKSPNEDRRNVAISIIEKIRKESGHLVQQAMLVSEELVGAAIIAQEMWHEAIEEASKEFYINKNFKQMMAVLQPMIEKLKTPDSHRDQAFVQMYGKSLNEAYGYCLRYQSVANPDDDLQSIDDLAVAWEIFSRIYKNLHQTIQTITTVELPFISPRLADVIDLDIAVPGTYQASTNIIRIKRIYPILNVIPSKQRPRKLTIIGSDGKDYKYCLKGHEDLRQDERVMQLFGLVNDLLSSNSETSKIHLFIHCYDVIPLSTMSGLIGWVPHSDTLHQLIKDYRTSKQLAVDSEKIKCTQIAPRYDNLTSLQKLEVFTRVLDDCKQREMDLADILWLKSGSSEIWLERRTNFTRSVALMSMVGYILGLGDRHPSNLMLQRFTGNVVHIDFGDCFEVAMNREKFPEKIPFRLTRMLVNAMEVSGIEGTFRLTCEKVMTVLRQNKDSLMAVLEAFVYDPLIVTILGGKDRSEQTGILDQDNQRAQNVVSKSASMKTEMDLLFNETDDMEGAYNNKAGSVMQRVLDKLTGKDFGGEELDVPNQVDKLIQQARSIDNLSQCYQGWCPFW